jgi:hypothetical protein
MWQQRPDAKSALRGRQSEIECALRISEVNLLQQVHQTGMITASKNTPMSQRLSRPALSAARVRQSL